MDIVCTRCGEPWAVDHVLHDEPDGFERVGGFITWCPCCPETLPARNAEQEKWFAEIRAVAEALGHDVDGLALTLQELNLL